MPVCGFMAMGRKLDPVLVERYAAAFAEHQRLKEVTRPHLPSQVELALRVDKLSILDRFELEFVIHSLCSILYTGG